MLKPRATEFGYPEAGVTQPLFQTLVTRAWEQMRKTEWWAQQDSNLQPRDYEPGLNA